MERNYPHEKIESKQVAFFPGAQFGLLASMEASLKKSDPEQKSVTLIQNPGYPNYKAIFGEAKKLAERPNASLGHIDCKDKGYATADELEKSITQAQSQGNKVEDRKSVV